MKFYFWTEFKVACANSLQVYGAVHKCVRTKVWNCREILAYCAQFNDIFSGTHALYCCGNLHTEEALSSSNINFPSSNTYTSLQWVLSETLPTHLHCVLCWGMYTSHNNLTPYGKGLPSFFYFFRQFFIISHLDIEFGFCTYRVW